MLNGLKTSTNSYGEEVLTIARNRTQAPAATWTDEENHKFGVDDSWERELTIFRNAILDNSPIEICGIEDAECLMEMVDKVYSR